MAVNALGLPLLFQTGPGQLGDLFSGLQSGDILRGRVIELVGQDQAVISIRGQNLVAQLPANSGLQKGDALSLQVGPFNPADLAKGASLTLRLLPSPDPASLLSQALAPGTAQAGPGAPGRLELILNAVQLPPSSINMKVAETLSQLGAPMDRAAIQTAAQATLALLGSEAAAPPPQPGSTALGDPSVQNTLRDGLSQLQVAAQFNPSSQNVLILQQAVRAIGLALEQPGLLAPAVAPSQGAPLPPANVGPVPSPSTAAPRIPSQAQAVLSQALAAIASEPSPQNLQNLQGLLASLAAPQALDAASASSPQGMAQPLSGGIGLGMPRDGAPSLNPAAAAPGGPAPIPTSAPAPSAPAEASAANLGAPYTGNAALPAQREALVQFLSGIPADAPTSVPSARAALLGLSAALSEPASPASLRLLAAVQAQQPGTEAQNVLASARQALQQADAALALSPEGAVFNGESALKSALQAAGLPVPQARLASLSSDQVAEAVAWLQARDLPPQRPLVETVATWISQDRNAMPAAGRALDAASQLPQTLLEARPSLQAAVSTAQQSLQQAGLSPEHPELATALRQWGQTQGLNLEAGLMAGTSDARPSGGAAQPMNGSAGLRPALVRLEGELRAAIRDNAAQTPSEAQRLGTALKETQAAVQALNAVPLQAQAPPAFDTVHLPLPVWMNGQIAGGQLSVTWRKGRERKLDDKEAVNVAVALNTESLGTVKVLMQVWKGSASARVLGETPEATAFLSRGAAELREGFAERTPFLLQNLEFAVAGAKNGPEAPVPEDAAPGGLNVSA